MSGVLQSSTRLAAKRVAQRTPRSLRGLSAPNLHRKWSNLADMAPAEKEELLHGDWREAKPIELVPDKADRDNGGVVAPLQFSTEEAAHSFLVEEDADDARELKDSTLELAQRFFADLATTADEELDAAQLVPPTAQTDAERRQEMIDVQREFFADFYMEQRLCSTQERYMLVDAMLRPSHALFLVNPVYPLVRLTIRDQLESHQAACLVKNTEIERSLASFEGVGTMSQEMISPSSADGAQHKPTFVQSELDPCLYVVPSVPSQNFGAPLHVPYSAATSLLPPAEALSITAAIAESTHTAVDEAALLGAMLQDDEPFISDAVEQPKDDKVTEPLSMTAKASSAQRAVPLTQPPSLAHTYWLQRHIASDAIANVDDLGIAIGLLSVQLAAACASSSSPYELLLFQSDSQSICRPSSTSTSALAKTSACAYQTEAALAHFKAREEASEDGDAATLQRLSKVVLLVEDSSVNSTKAVALFSSSSSRFNGSVGRPHMLQEREAAAFTALCEDSVIAVADRHPNVVYIPPLSSSRAFSHPPIPLRACGVRVVVCVPLTSQDGLRPRGWLSSDLSAEEEVDVAELLNTNDSATALSSAPKELTGTAPPNNFIERCQYANANFEHLQQELYRAIRAAATAGGGVTSPASSSRDDAGGWVVYATQSMNVMENEAVVCAVLQRIKREVASLAPSSEQQQATSHQSRSTTALQVECVPMNSPALVAHITDGSAKTTLQQLAKEGRQGLSTWVAINGGATSQEAGQYDVSLREAVAAASWRTDPIHRNSDGGYLICLRVTRLASVPHPQRERMAEERAVMTTGRTDEPHPPTPDALVDAVDCRWWTHPSSRVISAVTPATAAFLADVTKSVDVQPNPSACSSTPVSKASKKVSATAARARDPHRVPVLHAGVPVGLDPTPSFTQDSLQPVSTSTLRQIPLTSAVAHADVLQALQAILPVLRLSAAALSELLLTKRLSARQMNRLLRIRHKQSPMQRGGNVNVEAETSTLFASVERLLQTHSSPTSTTDQMSFAPRQLSVWVGVEVDSLVVPENHFALHPAVSAELERTGVVAQLCYTRQPSRTSVPPRAAFGYNVMTPDSYAAVECMSAAPPTSRYDFTLSLEVPTAMTEHAKQVVAVEEWRVAFRDALLYVARRTGATAASHPVWKSAAARVGEEGKTSLTADDPEEELELSEDEYEVTSEAMDGRQEEYNGRTALRGGDRHFNFSPHRDADNGDQQQDWLTGTNYREWRRQRARRGL